MQDSMFMVCLTVNGKKNTKNNYFSLSLGNNSTKLQGLWFTSSWWIKILSQASVTPPEEPGKANIYFPLERTAQALDCIEEVPTVSKLKYLNTSPKPGICLSAISLRASGVISLPVNPVPPVVMITSISFFSTHWLRILIISFLLSLQIYLSTKLWLAFLIFSTSIAPDLSVSKVLVSVTVRSAILTFINFYMIILSILFFVTALLYASVGFGGGSTYLALMLIWVIHY